MQDDNRPVYSRKHVELLVKLAFIKGQEFAVANMLREANERVTFSVGEDYVHQESESGRDTAIDQIEAGHHTATFAVLCG